MQEMSLPELRHELKLKTVRLLELEKELEVTARECREEQAQRMDSAIVIAEMARDMKTMIETMKS